MNNSQVNLTDFGQKFSYQEKLYNIMKLRCTCTLYPNTYFLANLDKMHRHFMTQKWNAADCCRCSVI